MHQNKNAKNALKLFIIFLLFNYTLKYMLKYRRDIENNVFLRGGGIFIFT